MTHDPHEFEVIVAGVGAMGAATCWQLARRGVRVLGLEQFSIPHALGSSHGDSRMIRLCYYEHPDYVPLLHRAYELWDALQEEAGHPLLFRTGGLYIGAEDGAFVRGTLQAARLHGLAHEQLSHATLRSRFPQFQVGSECIGVMEPQAGFLLPERAVAAFASLAIHHGAELHGHEPIASWQSTSSGIEVRTARSVYRARHLVLTAGAWSSTLLGSIGVPLKVTRQVLGWVQPRDPSLFAMGAMPVWAIDHADGTQHYGFPMLPGRLGARPGFKIAHHFHGISTTPFTVNRVPQAEDEADFRQALQRHLPLADGPLLAMAICMYTCSPDSHFIIDQHPAAPAVTIACGFSGHGFKFASVVGEILADLAINGSTRHPIEFLGLARFGRLSRGQDSIVR